MNSDTSDAAGGPLDGGPGAPNRVEQADEDDDGAEWAVVTQGFVPLGDGFFARSAPSDLETSPTDVHQFQ